MGQTVLGLRLLIAYCTAQLHEHHLLCFVRLADVGDRHQKSLKRNNIELKLKKFYCIKFLYSAISGKITVTSTVKMSKRS
jgi:hypothetical protein